ncbi:MAG TPA: hypothetical protein IAA04_02135 [Candidatus Lachnoclostridium pullistercoris]|uniref:DUF998 domain-containing protein n=1 Tax=Candidatus Lachnoclostridium pullistercoris TaxID=2838632 RepID=A0A9D2PAX6_9FIRM|nr:hypothetical protein [Candidatus Lachnoclostridium pullistercoris]
MIYDFLAYCLIPAVSVCLAGPGSWTDTNFSILRSSGMSGVLFLSWGAVLILCFFLWFRDISQRLSASRAADRFAGAAGLILSFALLTPYLPEQFPFWSRLHFYCAFLSPVLFMIGLLLLLLLFRRENPLLARRFLSGFWLIAGVSLALLWAAGMVTSALEIFFSSACSVFLRRLHRRVVQTG